MGLTGKQISDLDQAGRELGDHLVPLLARYFKSLLENGFTREEALVLTRDFFTTTVALGMAASKNTPKTE